MGSVVKCIHETPPHAVVPSTTLATDALKGGLGGAKGVKEGGTYRVSFNSQGSEFKSGSQFSESSESSPPFGRWLDRPWRRAKHDAKNRLGH